MRFNEAVSGFLQREDSYALPERQRHLIALYPAQTAGVVLAGNRCHAGHSKSAA